VNEGTLTVTACFPIQLIYTILLGLEKQLIRTFDKLNSNRTYQLEKDSDEKVSLMVNITKGKKTGMLCYRKRVLILVSFLRKIFCAYKEPRN
jgi:hypothetical protein